MILTVTPGINLSSVTGPISKAQLNQLGQPTVALSPGSVVAADTNFTQLQITDGTYPFWQLTNTGAPTDKKRLRASVTTAGTIDLARINDAQTVSTNLFGVSLDNRISLGPNGQFNSWVNAASPALSSPAGSMVDMFRWDGSNGNQCSLRLSQVRNTTGGDWMTATTRLQHFTDGVPQGFIEFNPSGLNQGVALGTTNGSNVNTPVMFLTAGAGGNNVGIGTTSTPEKLSVAGAVRIVTNGAALMWTDQSGTTPYMVAASDGNFYFTGTTAAGAGRSIFQCAMRSDTSPLQVNVPLMVGSDGANISRIRSVLFTESSSRVISSGSTITTDISLVGVKFDSDLTVTPIYELSDKKVIVRARPNGTNVVRVEWTNPTAAAITIDSNSYRVLETRISI
jgi:hypothetical protein